MVFKVNLGYMFAYVLADFCPGLNLLIEENLIEKGTDIHSPAVKELFDFRNAYLCISYLVAN